MAGARVKGFQIQFTFNVLGPSSEYFCGKCMKDHLHMQKEKMVMHLIAIICNHGGLAHMSFINPEACQDGPGGTAFSIKSNLHTPRRETLAFAMEGVSLIQIITLGYRDCVATGAKPLRLLKLLNEHDRSCSQAVFDPRKMGGNEAQP